MNYHRGFDLKSKQVTARSLSFRILAICVRRPQCAGSVAGDVFDVGVVSAVGAGGEASRQHPYVHPASDFQT